MSHSKLIFSYLELNIACIRYAHLPFKLKTGFLFSYRYITACFPTEIIICPSFYIVDISLWNSRGSKLKCGINISKENTHGLLDS